MEKKLDMEVKRLATDITAALVQTQKYIADLDKLFCANHAFHDGQTYKRKIVDSKILDAHEVVWTSNGAGGPNYVFGVRRATCPNGFDTRCAELNERFIVEVLPALQLLIADMLLAAKARSRRMAEAVVQAECLFNIANNAVYR